MTFKEFAAKRVAGVPVLYLAGAFVVILAIVAWKMKPSPSNDKSADGTESDPSAGAGLDNSAYDGLATQGTVTVVQQPSNPADVAPTVKSNSTWVSEGAQWLVANNKAPGTVAIAALTKYINDADRTYDDEQLINAVIKQFGPPPDGVSSTGNVGPKPAQKQFSNLPGTHTVTGNSDTTFAALATLYYGNSGTEAVDSINVKNQNIGGGPFPTGTKVLIPVLTPPRYYFTPLDKMTKPQVASKNGISVATLDIYNNGPNYNNATYFPKNHKFRVG